MRPWYETENEKTGKTQRVYWDAETANRKAAEIRQEAIDFLNNRDLERASAAGIPVSEGDVYLPTCSRNGKGEMEIDPVASRIKHSGAETNDLFIPRWQEFCSTPQHPEDFIAKQTVTYKPKQAFESGTGYFPAHAVSSQISETVVKPKRKYTRRQEAQAV